MRNNKLSVAVHIVCAIEKFSKMGLEVNSNFLAGSVNTNPAAIRRAVSTLSKANIIYTDNGYHVIDFETLSLYDIQKAVDPEGHLLYAHTNGNELCPVGSKIEGTMTDIYSRLQANVEDQMKSQMLSDIIKNFE